MPNDAWWAALRRVTARALDALESAARADPSFARDLMQVLHGLPPAGRPVSEPPAPPTVPAQRVPAAPAAPAPRPPLRPLHLEVGYIGPQIVAPAPPQYPKAWTNEPPDLQRDASRLAANCRLKARAARWQLERSRKLDAGEDVQAGDQEIYQSAKSADVFVWMTSPSKWRERNETSIALVSGCYEALADAVELMALADRLGRPPAQEEAMRLLAEAQSAVRAVVEDYASTGRDRDQESVFLWLRRETERRHVYVHFMQLDNPARPDNHADLRRRIGAHRQSLEGLAGREHAVNSALKRIEYHARKLRELPEDQPISPEDSDFRRIAETTDRLVADGLPPSDARLRSALIEAAPRFPDDAAERHPALGRVLAAIEEFLDAQEAQADDDDRGPANVEQEADPLLVEARRRVAGRDALLIGGVPDEQRRRALEAGLGLRSLNWLRVEHHEPFDAAESAIRRPGVGLVLIMTRWRSHRDGPAARSACKAAGVPLVELPAGYGLRQVAHQVILQMPSAGAVIADDSAIDAA